MFKRVSTRKVETGVLLHNEEPSSLATALKLQPLFICTYMSAVHTHMHTHIYIYTSSLRILSYYIYIITNTHIVAGLTSVLPMLKSHPNNSDWNDLSVFHVDNSWFFKLTLCSVHNVVPGSKVHGANMRSIWGRQDPGGPHFGPMNFTLWGNIHSSLYG